MEARSIRKDEKKPVAPKRRVMAVGMRMAGGSWWIRSRFRTEAQAGRAEVRSPASDRVA